ncbi:hypothetical protein RND71_035198 [Anisodus tanguticus]|uniref:Uncharacterized protein n=1 Tax=Anisodus tanguticus TaxID=243964 RepID=A0AAE1UVN0_9SOLA|nr:hypothetical protein RND71_035198 [Anisodus tanguticus]
MAKLEDTSKKMTKRNHGSTKFFVIVMVKLVCISGEAEFENFKWLAPIQRLFSSFLDQ